VLFATLLGAAGYCPAQHADGRADGKADTRLDEVVISAARVNDERITQQVQKTLTADPWIFADHITVTTENGVVRLEGIIGDTGELFRVLRLARKIPGARRVVSELEIMHNDPDGG
jgi:osmotically-inducible protein OsmY